MHMIMIEHSDVAKVKMHTKKRNQNNTSEGQEIGDKFIV